MFKALSKSVAIMFAFDLFVLISVTAFSCSFFDFSPENTALTVAATSLTGFIVLFLKGYYKIREFNITPWNAYRLFEGVVFMHVPVAVILFFLTDKTSLIKFLPLNIALIWLILFIYRLGFHYYLVKIKKVKSILILGTDERAKIIADEIQNKYALKMNVAGFVHFRQDDFCIRDNNVPVFDEPDNLKELIRDNNIDIVVIAQPTELILTAPRNIKIYKMPEFYEMVTGKYYIDEKTVTELYYQYVTHRSFVYDFLKRAYDIIAALIILIVTLPVTAYIALRVKMTDGANPFFTQTRVGKDGKTFECIKLRTMYINDYIPKNGSDVKYAESVSGDDRIIPFCKIIRKARLDEIPQMINILKGEMSIVGPRAEWKSEADIFRKNIPYYSGRMWVKTGWTGWSHINMNPVFTVDEERERLEYDFYYIKHRNIIWEIGILIKAVFLALGGRHK